MNLREIIKAWIISFNPTERQQEIANLRTDICQNCTSIKTKMGVEYCKECGCPIIKKVYTDSFNPCPLKKWKDIDQNYFLPPKTIKTLL